MLTGIGLASLMFASAIYAYGRHLERAHRAWIASLQLQRNKQTGRDL